MEDILEIYERPEDEAHPLVCMNECPKQLIEEIRAPIPMEPGTPERYDYEYKRNGTCNIFMFAAPLRGWRRVEVTEQRTRTDWADQIQRLVDEDFPEAEKIILVMDNLNTHSSASLYQAFPPEEAKRIADRLEIHYTPKHGSWLNMAEIELSVLNNQGVDDRVPDLPAMTEQVQAWARMRNSAKSKIDWRFTNKDARIKLKRLYPQFQS